MRASSPFTQAGGAVRRSGSSTSAARRSSLRPKSTAGDDGSVAVGDDRDDLDSVVEDDDVGGGARLEHTDVRAAEETGRHGRGGADRLLERNAETMKVTDGLDHR